MCTSRRARRRQWKRSAAWFEKSERAPGGASKKASVRVRPVQICDKAAGRANAGRCGRESPAAARGEAASPGAVQLLGEDFNRSRTRRLNARLSKLQRLTAPLQTTH